MKPLEQARDHVLVNPRFASQPTDEGDQVHVAALKLSSLGSELCKLTACVFRLVAKSGDLVLLLACLGMKASEFAVRRGRVFRHERSVRNACCSR